MSLILVINLNWFSSSDCPNNSSHCRRLSHSLGPRGVGPLLLPVLQVQGGRQAAGGLPGQVAEEHTGRRPGRIRYQDQVIILLTAGRKVELFLQPENNCSLGLIVSDNVFTRLS